MEPVGRDTPDNPPPAGEARPCNAYHDLPVAFACLDHQGRFLDASEDLLRLLGVTLDEIRGQSFAKLTHPDHRAADLEGMARLQRKETPRYSTKKRYLTPDGRTVWADVTVSIVRDDAGQFRHILAVVHDATEAKAIEDSLRNSEAFLNESQEIAHIGSYDNDLVTGTWTASKALEDLFGVPHGQVHRYEDWEALLHPDDRGDLTRYFAEEVVGKGQPFDREYRLDLQRAGGPVWVHGRGALRFDANGRPVRMVGTIQDVTARKRAEDAHRANELKYRTLVEQLNVGVFQTRLDGTFVHANAACARVAGYDSVEEFMAIRATRLYADPQARTRFMEAMLRDGSVRDLELTSVRRDGTTFPLSISAVLLRDDKGRPEGLLGVIEDITDRKRAEEAAMRAEHLESLGILAGGIAHDFNNLLAGIFGYLELAQEATREPAVKRLLADAAGVHGRAQDLTRQLLTFARGGRPERRPGALAPVLEAATRFALSGTNVTCRFDLAEDLRPCDFDRHQIAQVVDNIVINAVQAMPLGGAITIKARNETLPAGRHSLLTEGEYVRVEFVDSGIGIPREILPRIFDPFFTTKQKGSGLGLATAHSIIRRHDGHIEVDSEPGKGTTFRVWLRAGATAPAPQAATPPIVHQGHGTALLLDDEPSVREVLSQMLGALGYEVVAAGTGIEVLDLYSVAMAEGRDIRFAIVDLTIPGEMGGIQVLRLLRSQGATFPIIAASGYAEDPAVAEPARFGFAGSLQKPFTRADLARLLDGVLGKGKPAAGS